MNDVPSASSATDSPESEIWKRSRSGAWSGRGYRYQYWVTVLILLRQWSGRAPLGYLVPEGEDDCVIELSDQRIWLQTKSRKEGKFLKSEINAILQNAKQKATRLPDSSSIRTTVVLEQPSSGHAEADIEHLFESEAGHVFICNTPEEKILQLLQARYPIAAVIAQGLADDLYSLVSSISAENASLPFSGRRKISSNEIDRRIFERLEAENPSAIDNALHSGILEPVDFTTPVNDPDFYMGVKVKPGHVSANLVLDRPKDAQRVIEELWEHRHVLISGPSGSGKSALTWLSATATADQIRWYQITRIAKPADAEEIIRFLRAHRPTEISPLGLIFDEIESGNSTLWDILTLELRGLPHLYLLGSLRQEDVHLITKQSETVFVTIRLEEELARTVWEKLDAKNATQWSHWREPFEQSEGLMLEYIHILTQGRRLANVIEDQIRQREHEHRNDELKILRSTAVICTRGGEIDAIRLFELLELDPNSAKRALRRLIDEHLVRESRPGVLGGLHILRSNALMHASHDETVFHASISLWGTLAAATTDTLPHVVQAILSDELDQRDSSPLDRLAKILAQDDRIELWTAIITGLGLATLDLHATSFISILERNCLERAHWDLAAMFADPSLDVPSLPESEKITLLRCTLKEFREMTKPDLRSACLAYLPPNTALPHATDISQANALLSALVPISGGDPIQVSISHDYLTNEDLNIRQIAGVLSTAYQIDPELAIDLVDKIGGEQILFDMFSHEIPWSTPPKIVTDSRNGRTVRSDWYQVSDEYQPDPHETVCEICEILIGISPESNAASCDAINPAGDVITVGNFQPWSKNIPRVNLPAKARIAWNIAFRQSFFTISADCSLTEYTRRMAEHVRHTEKVFRSFSEKWISGKKISNAETLASECTRIITAVNSLAYAAFQNKPPTMTKPFNGPINETLGGLITGILGNLVRRMSKIDGIRATATFAGSLHGQALEHHQSTIWRTISSPPLIELTKLADRLQDVSSILHEFAHDGSPENIDNLCKIAKKASLGKSISTTARRCRERAERRMGSRLHKLQSVLSDRGWNARCLSRQIDEYDSPYWPAKEIAILVEVHDLAEEWYPKLEELLSASKEHLDRDWRFCVAPVLNGHILPSLATVPTSHIPLPDQDFSRKWNSFLYQPMLTSTLLNKFEEAYSAVLLISSIINTRGIRDLHPDEESLFFSALENYKSKRAEIEFAVRQPDTEYYAVALQYLEQIWGRLTDELNSIESEEEVEAPLCMTPHQAISGCECKDTVDFAIIRLTLLQEECNRLSDTDIACNTK